MNLFDNALINQIATLIVTLFIIIDPVGGAPIVSSLLRKYDRPTRNRIIRRACLVSFLILLGFSISGRSILQLFQIDIQVFRMAGGLLLLITAIDMIFHLLPQRDLDEDTISIIPISYPLLAGPGTMSILMFSLGKSGFLQAILVASVSLVVVILPVYFILRASDRISRFLGNKGSILIEKLMGVLLTAIALDLIVKAIVYYLRPGSAL